MFSNPKVVKPSLQWSVISVCTFSAVTTVNLKGIEIADKTETGNIVRRETSFLQTGF